MPNINKVNGFRPVRYLNGAPYTGAQTRYFAVAAEAGNIFVGDLVKLSGAAVVTNPGQRAVIVAVAGDATLGAVTGFDIAVTNLDTPQFRTTLTARQVFVADDPNILFVAQEDGVTTPIPTAAVGLNVNFIVAAGSTVTGASGMQIDSDTVLTTATLPLKIIEALQNPDNEIITAGQAFTRWVVKINNHQLGSGTGTAGV